MVDLSIKAYKTEVQTGKYTFSVEVKESYWEGGKGGDMEDMPGTFLEAKVALEDILGELTPIEQLAVQHKVVLSEINKEITNEPKGYTRLYYDDLVEKVQTNPERYTKDIKRKVKEKL